MTLWTWLFYISRKYLLKDDTPTEVQQLSETNNTLSVEDKRFLLEYSKYCSILSENLLAKYGNNISCWKCGKQICLGDIFCKSSGNSKGRYLCRECYQGRLIDIPDVPNCQLCKELGLPQDYLEND